MKIHDLFKRKDSIDLDELLEDDENYEEWLEFISKGGSSKEWFKMKKRELKRKE